MSRRKMLATKYLPTTSGVIEENLTQTIIHQDGKDFSFYERLRSLQPELTKEEYRDTHKAILEYLARLTHKQAVKELKRSF